MYNTTVARLTYRALLGRRRALLLCALPLLLLVVAVAVRLLGDVDDDITKQLLGGFAMATIVPLIGVVAGTGAIGPEIDDGSVVYLLSKPLRRSSIVVTKLLVAIGVVVGFGVLPVAVAGIVLTGELGAITVGFALGALAGGTAYAALFLLLPVLTKNAVVIGLIYALIWESLVGGLVPGAQTLSVQQWSLAVVEKVLGIDAPRLGVHSAVGFPTGMTLLVLVTVAATAYAGRRLETVRIGESD
jgi:ABC-2 type transport system permease protein